MQVVRGFESHRLRQEYDQKCRLTLTFRMLFWYEQAVLASELHALGACPSHRELRPVPHRRRIGRPVHQQRRHSLISHRHDPFRPQHPTADSHHARYTEFLTGRWAMAEDLIAVRTTSTGPSLVRHGSLEDTTRSDYGRRPRLTQQSEVAGSGSTTSSLWASKLRGSSPTTTNLPSGGTCLRSLKGWLLVGRSWSGGEPCA